MTTSRTPRPARDLVRSQSHAIVEVAQHVFGADFDALRTDPCAVLEAWGELDFRLVADVATTAGLSTSSGGDTGPGAGCSVAGAYLDADPNNRSSRPVMQVAHAASSGRRAFTALHELGHHLQRTRVELAETLWGHPDIEMFEDLACDGFAADLLLPADEVATVIGDRGPTAHDVVALHEKSHASRSAVCVHAAQRLPAPGHVVLLDEDGKVFFAAATRMPPLRKGSDQSSVGLVSRALHSGTVRGRDQFRYRDGIAGEELFIQCTPMGPFIVAVAVTDHAPWEGFTVPTPQRGPQGSNYECANPACGATYVSFEKRCERCSVAPCPECGRCSCVATAAEKTCQTCWLVKPAAGFVGTECADCAA